MESGHDILLYYNSAHCAYVGVCVREGVRERERKEGDRGWCVYPHVSYITSDFVCKDSQSSMS